MYETRWPVGAEAESIAPEVGTWLVLMDGAGVGEGLCASLGQQGSRCVRVWPGEAFARRADGSLTVRPEHLVDFLDNLDLDGLYFDDTNWGSHDDRPWFPGCCCDHCEKLFKQETGLRIPTRVDFSSPDFRKFVNWRSDKLRDFFLHLTRKVKEKHPHAILDFNHYGRPTTDWSDGHPLNPLHLEQVGAHFFIETFGSIRQTGFVSKVARAYGSPFAMWRNVVQSLPECVGSSAPYAEPWSQILHGLTAMANGGRPQYGGFDGPMPLRRELMRSVFAEIRKRVDYIDGETVNLSGVHGTGKRAQILAAADPVCFLLFSAFASNADAGAARLGFVAGVIGV
jgi:hypothetical protein